MVYGLSDDSGRITLHIGKLGWVSGYNMTSEIVFVSFTVCSSVMSIQRI